MKLENEALSVEVDASHGGRIISFFDKRGKRELLWYDAARLPVNPALDYDGNFAGGMDELLPNDPPENGYPDHGELWMTALTCEKQGEGLELFGNLPVSKLSYSRKMHLEGASLVCDYKLSNTGFQAIDFLWKMHGAFAISEGDCLYAPAGCVQAADPGDWSKCADGMPRRWRNPYQVASMDGSSDFFYLTELTKGELILAHEDGTAVKCLFDTNIFKNAWIFASFGRLNGSRTMILEPCTNYPLTLTDAKKSKVCAHLEVGQSLDTRVVWQLAIE